MHTRSLHLTLLCLITALALAVASAGCERSQSDDAASAGAGTESGEPAAAEEGEPGEQGEENAASAPSEDPAATDDGAETETPESTAESVASASDTDARAPEKEPEIPTFEDPIVQDPTKPLPEPVREILWNTPEDDPPEELDASREDLKGRHYMSSDEYHQYNFEPALRDLGGAYMGVGTDQGYLMIGWQRPAFAWLADYDPYVVLLHHIYREFFERSQTPDDLYRHFARKKQGLAVIDEAFGDHKQHELYRDIFKDYRYRIGHRLRTLGNLLDEKEIAGFVNDQEQFDFVKLMIANDRVRPIQSNLLADKGVQGIAKAARTIGMPIRAFYVSNAESYWNWDEGHYRENIKALPFDEKSIILRAIASMPVNDDYRYNTQPALNYQTWIFDERIPPNYIYMIPRRSPEGPDDFPYTHFDEPPEFGVKRMKRRERRKAARERRERREAKKAAKDASKTDGAPKKTDDESKKADDAPKQNGDAPKQNGDAPVAADDAESAGENDGGQ